MVADDDEWQLRKICVIYNRNLKYVMIRNLEETSHSAFILLTHSNFIFQIIQIIQK